MDTAPNSHLYYQVGVGIPDTPVCASQVLGTVPSSLRETSSLPRGSQVAGGRGNIGIHTLTGEKAISISRILPKAHELAFEMLSNLEQAGDIQQGILNVLPQPVGVLQRNRPGARGAPEGGGSQTQSQNLERETLKSLLLFLCLTSCWRCGR